MALADLRALASRLAPTPEHVTPDVGADERAADQRNATLIAGLREGYRRHRRRVPCDPR
jgi:hypothetical protein